MSPTISGPNYSSGSFSCLSFDCFGFFLCFFIFFFFLFIWESGLGMFILFMVGGIINFVFSIILGYVSDRIYSPFGRRYSWIVSGMLLNIPVYVDLSLFKLAAPTMFSLKFTFLYWLLMNLFGAVLSLSVPLCFFFVLFFLSFLFHFSLSRETLAHLSL